MKIFELTPTRDRLISMIGDVVKNCVFELRTKNKKITQEELAHAVGVTRQTIIAIEKNNYQPSVQLAIRIANYFRLPVERVFWLE